MFVVGECVQVGDTQLLSSGPGAVLTARTAHRGHPAATAGLPARARLLRAQRCAALHRLRHLHFFPVSSFPGSPGAWGRGEPHEGWGCALCSPVTLRCP